MKLKDLLRDWKSYAWEVSYNGRPVYSLILERTYRGCKLQKLAHRGGCGILFFCRYSDDGSWGGHPWDILKSDEWGNCYFFGSNPSNLNKFFWIRNGRFVKIKPSAKK